MKDAELYTLSDPELLLLALGVLGSLLLAIEIGYRAGRRSRGRYGEGIQFLTTIHAAVLGLLALMLAFTYGFVSARADARKQAIVEEANALGTAFLRAGLAPEPLRGEIRSAIRDYISARMVSDEEAGDPGRTRLAQEAFARAERRLASMFRDRSRLGGRTATPIDALVVGSLNAVLDTHTRRVAASQDRLPGLVLALQLSIALLAVGLAGFSAGISGRRNSVFTSILALSIAAVIVAIVDLGLPQSGFVRVSGESLTNTLRMMEEGGEADAGPGEGMGGRERSGADGDGWAGSPAR